MQSETPTSKTDLLFFLANKRLSAGAIYVRFLRDRSFITSQGGGGGEGVGAVVFKKSVVLQN